MVTVTWLASEYKVHKLHQGYIILVVSVDVKRHVYLHHNFIASRCGEWNTATCRLIRASFAVIPVKGTQLSQAAFNKFSCIVYGSLHDVAQCQR